MSVCEESNPDRVWMKCQRNSTSHQYHSYYDWEEDLFVDWPNKKYVKPEKTQKKSDSKVQTITKIKGMISRINK